MRSLAVSLPMGESAFTGTFCRSTDHPVREWFMLRFYASMLASLLDMAIGAALWAVIA